VLPNCSQLDNTLKASQRSILFSDTEFNFIVLCIFVQAFGWFALFAYIADLVLAIIAYRKGVVYRSETTTHHETAATTTTARY